MPDVDIGALQSQLAGLRVDLAGLQAQWRGLKSQLDNMLRSNPARPGVQQQWADVGVQMARVQGNIAVVEARIAMKRGTPVGIPGAGAPPPWNNPGIVIPAFSVVSLAFILPLSIGWARRIARRPAPPAPIPHDVTMRLGRIENAIETVAIEVERISEGQRFVTKIMTERPAANRDQPSGQPRQSLALGAGEAPLEPIVVPEHDRVRKESA